MTPAEWIPIAIDAAQFIGTAAVGFYVWFSDRDAARASALRNLETDIDARLGVISDRLGVMETGARPGYSSNCIGHTARMATLEERFAHTVSAADLGHAHKRIDAVGEGLAELRGGIKRIERTLDLLSEHLLNQSHGHAP